jgi:hypothetical protein
MLAHVRELSTDERFIGFDLAGKLSRFVCRGHAKGDADSVIHEPSGFLRDLDSPVDLVRTHAIFEVHNLPHGKHPLIQTQRRVFEDRSSLRGKLSQGVLAATLPAVVLGLEYNPCASATRTGDAVRPAMSNQVLPAVVGASEVEDCLAQSVGADYFVHTRTLA